MVADWYDGLTLASEWRPASEGVVARYRLMLTNDTGEALRDFRLGISGPARVSDDAEIVGAKVVTQISNFCELAPERGFVLASGAPRRPGWRRSLPRSARPQPRLSAS